LEFLSIPRLGWLDGASKSRLRGKEDAELCEEPKLLVRGGSPALLLKCNCLGEKEIEVDLTPVTVEATLRLSTTVTFAFSSNEIVPCSTGRSSTSVKADEIFCGIFGIPERASESAATGIEAPMTIGGNGGTGGMEYEG
jgi:hypothetical protein